MAAATATAFLLSTAGMLPTTTCSSSCKKHDNHMYFIITMQAHPQVHCSGHACSTQQLWHKAFSSAQQLHHAF